MKNGNHITRPPRNPARLMDAAERDALAADDDHAGGADAQLNGDRLGPGPWRRPGGARALEPDRLLVGERWVSTQPGSSERTGACCRRAAGARSCAPPRS